MTDDSNPYKPTEAAAAARAVELASELVVAAADRSRSSWPGAEEVIRDARAVGRAVPSPDQSDRLPFDSRQLLELVRSAAALTRLADLVADLGSRTARATSSFTIKTCASETTGVRATKRTPGTFRDVRSHGLTARPR